MIAILLLIWLAIGALLMLVGSQNSNSSAGMPLAYFLGLSLIHTPGAAVYLEAPLWGPLAYHTLIGFQETVWGMSAFLAGVMVVRFAWSANYMARKQRAFRPHDIAILNRLSATYVLIGILYFVFGSVISISSIGSVIAQISSLVVVGACLWLWVAREEGNTAKIWLSMLALPLLPIVTLIKGGFLGAGVSWILTIASFLLCQSKRRLVFFILAPFLIYFGLSVFVNYMASRTEFREAVWYQQIGIGERIRGVANMFADFQWYDSQNPRHRKVIDGRLNQNMFVGAAAERLNLGVTNFAYGATLVDAVIGLIPRVLWPNKPQVGGGGTLVRDFTGIEFDKSTSVGAGQVLEFYVNFGTWGVIAGFFIYGGLIAWMDLLIATCLREGDQKGVLLWFLVCLALIQPGGNLIEIVVTVAASVVTAAGLDYFLTQRLRISLQT